MPNRSHSHLVRLLFLVLLGNLPAQSGDRRGQAQPDLPAGLKVPPAPVLAPAAALRSLRVQPGFKVELVAAEPLVVDPVCITFDARGRIWAVEMRGFMPNVDGEGELEPNGQVVVLSDTDGDGRMDRSVVFLDGLVLPRLVAIVNQGVLVLAPPHLYLCRDLDGDDRCDEKTLLRGGFGGRQSPEHAPNGALPGLDNWLQFAKFGERLRWLDGRWQWRKQVFRGQWGITMDDSGRHFHNGNSDHLRGDLYPAHYALRNRNLWGRAAGINIQIARDQSTWPIRITPGINRGYMPHMLRDYKLARFTGACSPVIYRDEVFPADCHGDAFVCEPCGNFVRRCKVSEQDGVLTAVNAYDKDEFLASTDERFRPVDLKIGPDGGLYVVDLYRGILQHRVFVTSFLRKQILARGLDRPVGLGRIYRVLPINARPRVVPRLHDSGVEQLVAALGHPSGWCRDQAQRLLIGRGVSVAEVVQRSVRSSTQPLARLHGLWVLEGVGGLSVSLLRHCLEDPDPQVQCAALRLAEPWLDRDAALLQAARGLAAAEDAVVVLQAALSLGAVTGSMVPELQQILRRPQLPAQLLAAVLTGLQGRELEVLEALCGDSALTVATPARRRCLIGLTRCVMREARAERIARLLHHVAQAGLASTWRAAVVLGEMAGQLEGQAKKTRAQRVLTLSAAPVALQQLASVSKPASRVLRRLAWPGRPRDQLVRPPRSQQDRALIKRGHRAYLLRCMACHQIHGKGQPGLAPSLLASPYVLGSTERLAAIILYGVTGPIQVNEQKFDGLMPPVPGLSDAEIASIMSYVRNSWGHRGSVVDESFVTKVRRRYQARGKRSFTAAELDKIE